jgi:hypothetical protein
MKSLHDAPGLLWDNGSSVIAPAIPIWIIAAVGLICIFRNRKASGALFFSTALLVCSFFAVCPGFYFRGHYFVLILPVVSLLAGAAVSSTTLALVDPSKLRPFRIVPSLVFLIAFGYAISQQWEYLFEMDAFTACHSVYGPNPFPETIQIADYLKTHGSQSASVAVLGSEPEIYFYSRRHSATGYIYTYPLMEQQPNALTMQKQMISDIEKAQPEFLVFVNGSLSWLRSTESPQLIFDWAQKYAADGYEIVGVADILEEGTQYRWGEEARSYTPVSSNTVKIFKRIRS